MESETEMYCLEVIKEMNEKATEKFHYVCLDCHETVKEINSDGDCFPCVTQANKEFREVF